MGGGSAYPPFFMTLPGADARVRPLFLSPAKQRYPQRPTAAHPQHNPPKTLKKAIYRSLTKKNKINLSKILIYFLAYSIIKVGGCVFVGDCG